MWMFDKMAPSEPIWQALIWETAAEVILKNGCQVMWEKQIQVDACKNDQHSTYDI